MPPLPPGEALAEQRASERNFMRLYKDDPVLNQALINRFYEPKYGQRAIDRFMPRLAKPATPFFSWQMLPGQPPLVTSGNLDWGMKMPWADPNPEERKFDIVTSGDLDA